MVFSFARFGLRFEVSLSAPLLFLLHYLWHWGCWLALQLLRYSRTYSCSSHTAYMFEPHKVVLAFNQFSLFCQCPRAISVRGAIEAFNFKVAHECPVRDISLLLQFAEITSIHNDEFPACATCRHDIVSLSCFLVCVVCLSYSLVQAKRCDDFFEKVHSDFRLIV